MYCRFLFSCKIAASLVLLLFCAFDAKGHDVGISTAIITAGDHQIEILLAFANKDAEALLPVPGNIPDLTNAGRFEEIRQRLQLLMVAETDLYLDAQRVAPDEVTVTRKESQTVQIRIHFGQVNSSRIRLVARFLERLPYGHREFVTIKAATGAKLDETMLSAGENSVELPAIANARPDHSFVAFLMLGVEHILTGYDHLLFLFGLLIVCRDLRSLLTVITCFTVAHSLTLALSTLEVIQLPTRIVEPLIALSIAYVGLENLLRGGAPGKRWLLTFCFGLVHGLGFAGALKEFGIESGRIGVVWPLAGFNLGVEIGQLSVAAVVLPILQQLRKSPHFVRQWVPLCSAAVVVAGSYWMVERILQK